MRFDFCSSFKGGVIGFRVEEVIKGTIYGSILAVLKGDTRSLDYSSCTCARCMLLNFGDPHMRCVRPESAPDGS